MSDPGQASSGAASLLALAQRPTLNYVDGYVTTVQDAPEGTVYRLVSVPSSAIIKRIICESPQLAVSYFMNVGVYYHPDFRGGIEVNQLAFTFLLPVGSAGTINTGRIITNSAGIYPIENRDLPIWETLPASLDSGAPFTSDPQCIFDICAIVASAVTESSKFLLSVEYA